MAAEPPPPSAATSARLPATSAGPSRLLAWVGIALGIVYLTFIGGSAALGIYVVQWRIASLAAIAIALLGWFVAAWRNPAWRPRTVLWPAFAAALAAFAISTVTSWSPRLSLEYVAYAVICTALYLLLVRLLAHPFFRPRLGGAAVLLTLSTGACYLALVLRDWIDWWSAVGRLTVPPLRPASESLTYGNPSAVATMMLLLCAASLAYLGAGTVRRRLLDALLLALTAAVVLLTGSRGAWLGSAIAVGALGLLLLLLPESRSALRRLAATRAVRSAALAVVLVVIAIGLVLLPSLLARLTANTLTSRLSFYVSALRMFASAPLLGSGPGTWVARRAAFTDPSGVDMYIPHAHDIYLQTLAEFGLLGALVGAVVVATLAWLVLGAIRGSDPVRRRYGWGAGFALVFLAGLQLVDFYANMPAVFFALALTVGVLDATSGPLPTRIRLPAIARHSPTTMRLPAGLRPRMGRLALGILPLLVLAALAFSAWSESAALTQEQAVMAANQGQWATALSRAQAAASADPAMPPYQFTLGIAAAKAGDLPLARDAFTREARTDDFPEAWLDLAAVQLRLGDAAAARADIARAMRLGAQQPVVAVPAASLDLRLGDTAAATQAIADAFALVPQLAADPYWSSSPALRTAANRALDPVILQAIIAGEPTRTDSTTLYQIALAAGQTAEAESLAAAFPPAQEAAADLVIRAWTGDRSALTALVSRVLASPLDVGVAGMASLVAERLGDVPVANRLADIAGQSEIVIGPTCGSCAAMTGANELEYGYFTYRRPVPQDLLVLDLPRLAYR